MNPNEAANRISKSIFFISVVFCEEEPAGLEQGFQMQKITTTNEEYKTRRKTARKQACKDAQMEQLRLVFFFCFAQWHDLSELVRGFEDILGKQHFAGRSGELKFRPVPYEEGVEGGAG